MFSVLLVLCAVCVDSLIEVDYSFPEGSACENSGRLLTLSIPTSCNEALQTVLRGGGLPVDLVRGTTGDLGDLCRSFCTVPMRQVGYDCKPILELNKAIDAACVTNSNGTRCFDVREWVWPVLEQCPAHLCDKDCEEQLQEAHMHMGCCLATTLSHSIGRSLEQCNNGSNYTLCSDSDTTSLSLLLIVLTLLALPQYCC